MSMVCASTYLYLLQFLSSVSFNFPSIGLLHPWLGLFLGILFFFEGMVNDIVFLISLSASLLLACRMQPISGYYFCLLLLCWIHLSDVVVCWWNLWGFPCIVSCHLQIKAVLLLPFQFRCLLFLLLVWLLWLRLPGLCWIWEVKADIPVLFLILRGTLVVFVLEYDAGSGFIICSLYYV